MARERMVTRTIEVREVEALCFDTEKMTPEKAIIPITGKPDETKLEKIVRDAIETDTFKLVKIVNVKLSEVLYGMPESEFIKLAKVLPPRVATTEKESEG